MSHHDPETTLTKEFDINTNEITALKTGIRNTATTAFSNKDISITEEAIDVLQTHMLADSLEIMQETDWPPNGDGLLNVDSPEAYFKRIVDEMNAGEAAALNNLAAVVGSIQGSVDEDHPIYQYHVAVVGGNYSKINQNESTSHVTVEESQSQQPEWIAKLTESNNRPGFSDVRSTAQNVVSSSPERLHITVYDPYTEQTHENTVKINTITETTIYCADEQVRLFKLPDGTTGHFNTQGGTDKMPDIVTDCTPKTQSKSG